MSGGEQQRAAIAVALVNQPKVLLADEPTGELDTATAAEVFGALQTANRELGVTVLIVTHDPAVSSVVRRVVAIRDGRTSTEIAPAGHHGDDGEVAQHAVEYAVLDRAGRLQLPKEMTEPLGMQDLVRLEGRTRPHRRLARPARPIMSEPAENPSEPKGRGAPWTEERGTSDEGRERSEEGMGRRVGPRRREEDTVAVEGVTRTFGSGRTATRALRGVSFAVQVRPAGGAARPVRIGEDHAAQHRRRP
jgi:ABC-type glutathione transport system ATPase component